MSYNPTGEGERERGREGRRDGKGGWKGREGVREKGGKEERNEGMSNFTFLNNMYTGDMKCGNSIMCEREKEMS